jgi:hypothetical protein
MGLSVPFVIMAGCCVAMAGRAAVDRLRAGRASTRRLVLDAAGGDDDSGSGNDIDAVPAPVATTSVNMSSLRERVVDAIVGPLLGPDDSLAAVAEPLSVKCKRVAFSLLHVAFFGGFKAVVGVVSCGSGKWAKLLPASTMSRSASFMHEDPAIVCSTDLPLYTSLLTIAGLFAVVYVLVFPALLVFVMWRHRAMLRADSVMLSPINSSVALPEASPRRAQHVEAPTWYAKLLHGWSHSQPFAELFWLVRRVAIALVLALIARHEAAQGVLLVLVLGGSIFLQRSIGLFEDRLDQQLDTMALWAILITSVYSRLQSDADTDEWSALAVCILVLDGFVLLVAVLSVLRREWMQKLSDRLRKSMARQQQHSSN